MKIISDEIKPIKEEKWFGVYFSDNMRHLVCFPYSIENLHKMAKDLGIKRCWFHKDHYDIPKRRFQEIKEKTIVITPKEMFNFIKQK